jgi:penicillin-insensitive murein endopeptidase
VTDPGAPRPSRRRRRAKVALAAVFLLAEWIVFGNDVAIVLEDNEPSQSVGTTANGHLVHGKRLPNGGANFQAYSRLGTALGRNAVHGQVRDAVLEAYATLARTQPGLVFVYGETGWPDGGRLRPHRTHRNGLSVDFFVPVRDRAGASVPLPTWPWTRFGYDIEFDATGRAGDLAIDDAAIVAHLDALDAAARRHGLRIERVIFDPSLQPALFAAPGGAGLRQRVPFMPGQAWVRHDEHYHVDFRLDPAP